MQDLLGMEAAEVVQWAVDQELPAYRGKQIFSWVQARGVTSLEEMSNLPKSLRTSLEEKVSITNPAVAARQDATDGETVKFLLRFADGASVETVLMTYEREESRDRNTVCLSTQVGCAMNCRFCATGQGGMERNLSAGEIMAQVWAGQRAARDLSRGQVTNVVFMGMGEPLLNLGAVLKSIRILNHPDGLNIGMRRITISTCGLVPEIRRLAAEKLPLTLAISLHAPNNALRARLMPVNAKYPVEELIKAARFYGESTGRRVTYEYALFKGVNDGEKEARELAGLLKGQLAYVNIIPANPVPKTDLFPAEPAAVTRFLRILTAAGITAVVRESKGADIDAACGQLRRRNS